MIWDTARGAKWLLATMNLLRGAVCLAPRKVAGTDSEDFLTSLVSKYNQITAIVSVALVYGSLYPPVCFVACISTAARTYADARLVRRGMNTGAHRNWDPQGARGLPLSSFSILLVSYCMFVGWFYGFGLVTTPTYRPIGEFLLPEGACVRAARW